MEKFDFLGNGGLWVFRLARSKFVAKIELTQFSMALGAIFIPNWGLTRARLLIWSRRWHHRVSRRILSRNKLFSAKFWKHCKWKKYMISACFFGPNFESFRFSPKQRLGGFWNGWIRICRQNRTSAISCSSGVDFYPKLGPSSRTIAHTSSPTLPMCFSSNFLGIGYSLWKYENCRKWRGMREL